MLLSQYGSWKPEMSNNHVATLEVVHISYVIQILCPLRPPLGGGGVGVLEAMLRPAEVDPHLKSYVDPHLWRYRSKTLCQFSSERLAMNRTWTSISRLQVLLIAKRLDENWRGVLGKGPATKFDEFSEKCHRGGGSFSIQKFMLQILGTFNRAF